MTSWSMHVDGVAGDKPDWNGALYKLVFRGFKLCQPTFQGVYLTTWLEHVSFMKDKELETWISKAHRSFEHAKVMVES